MQGMQADAGAPQKLTGSSNICVSRDTSVGGGCKGSVAGHRCWQHGLKTPGRSRPAASNDQGTLCCPGVHAQGDLGFETQRRNLPLITGARAGLITARGGHSTSWLACQRGRMRMHPACSREEEVGDEMRSGGWMLPSVTLWLFCLMMPNLGSYPEPFSRLCCLHPAGTGHALSCMGPSL